MTPLTPEEHKMIDRIFARGIAAVDVTDKAEYAHAVWANTEQGRMLGLNGPVHGESLRERIRLAFCAGHSAALAAQHGGSDNGR